MDRKVFRAEFGEDLEAGAAGGDGFAASADDGEGFELPVACGYGGGYGCSLGAEGEAIGCVFHVAAGKDLAVLG